MFLFNVKLLGDTKRITIGFSLPAIKPNPKSLSLSKMIFLLLVFTKISNALILSSFSHNLSSQFFTNLFIINGLLSANDKNLDSGHKFL